MASDRPLTLLLVANQGWNLVNYRAGLIAALRRAGFRIVAAAPSEPDSERRLRELGCDFRPIPLAPKSLSPFDSLRTVFALAALARQEQPAAILTWTIKANLWGSLVGRLAGIPVIANVSGLGIAHSGKGWLRRVAEPLYRICLKAASTVFFQNESDFETMVAAKLVRPQQARLLPGSGVDLEWFAANGRERPLERRFVMLARLLRSKGVEQFVEAARRIRARRGDLRFALLGFTDVANVEAITREQVDSWAAEGIVEYFEPVSDVRPILETAEAVVLPSYYREGLSRALLEGASMGRPIVTTDHPGCREAIEPGVTGFLCQPRDVDSLEQAILRVAGLAGAEWAAMSGAARERAVRLFSQDIIIERYLEALRDAGVATSNRSRSGQS